MGLPVTGRTKEKEKREVIIIDAASMVEGLEFDGRSSSRCFCVRIW